MKKIKISILLFAAILLAACGGSSSSKGSLAEGASGDMEAYESGDVNAMEQARPQIMVIPADQTLKSFGALKETKVDGKGYVVRDYQKYLVKDDRFRRLASFIQDAFVHFVSHSVLLFSLILSDAAQDSPEELSAQPSCQRPCGVSSS